MSAFVFESMRPFEAIVNRWIAQSSAARNAVRELDGRTMIVEIDNTNLRFVLGVAQQRLQLRAADTKFARDPRAKASADAVSDVTADIVIRAGMFDLMAMLGTERLSDLQAGEVEFRGNLRVAEAFGRLLRLARPQLEDELAGWIGGMPAHALAQAGDATFAWSRKTARAFELNVAEYLQAESQEVPYRHQLEEFFEQVERLRDDVDRLGRRIERLTRRFPVVDEQ